ncbi:MAG: A/G-specific adenine glycosylase [Paludibacteraceae bacterium]|nr:A/G-specific adenine glycosylase [Paludibacteraceae bacterium]
MHNSIFYSHLYRWYESNRRILPWRETKDAYCIWLSEVILQQTRVAQGMAYYMRFVERWPTVEALASADEAEVLREWQGLGYYSRARNLHKAAKMVVERGWSPFPARFEEIRSLPGVGEYTAGAIASFAYNAPYAAMDGNVYRVLARLFDIDEAFDTTAGKKRFRALMEELLDKEHARLFNSAIMEFGALYCTPSHARSDDVQGTKGLEEKCPVCPLVDFCLGHAHGTAELLPVRKPRPQVRDRWFTYHVYVYQPSEVSYQPSELFTIIRRRENPKDIWYHLYEFPCEEMSHEPSAISHQPSAGGNQLSFTHVLSHQRLHARFLIHRVERLPEIEGGIVIPWSELDQYALSRLTLRALDTMGHKGW